VTTTVARTVDLPSPRSPASGEQRRNNCSFLPFISFHSFFSFCLSFYLLLYSVLKVEARDLVSNGGAENAGHENNGLENDAMVLKTSSGPLLELRCR